MIRPVVAASLLLAACAPEAPAQDRVLGLLTLPQVFGQWACDVYSPTPITLHSRPDGSDVAGTIFVERPWTHHAAGGCEGLDVRVRWTGAEDTAGLPTWEHGYEEPAAIVVERRDGWFRIRLEDGSAWIQATEANDFLPFESLLDGALTYIADAGGAGLADAPGSRTRDAARDLLEEGRTVRLLEWRWVGADLWLRIVVLSHSLCDSLEEPVEVAEGWLPAHTAAGEPAVWFHSRGC